MCALCACVFVLSNVWTALALCVCVRVCLCTRVRRAYACAVVCVPASVCACWWCTRVCCRVRACACMCRVCRCVLLIPPSHPPPPPLPRLQPPFAVVSAHPSVRPVVHRRVVFVSPRGALRQAGCQARWASLWRPRPQELVRRLDRRRRLPWRQGRGRCRQGDHREDHQGEEGGAVRAGHRRA